MGRRRRGIEKRYTIQNYSDTETGRTYVRFSTATSVYHTHEHRADGCKVDGGTKQMATGVSRHKGYGRKKQHLNFALCG